VVAGKQTKKVPRQSFHNNSPNDMRTGSSTHDLDLAVKVNTNKVINIYSWADMTS